MRPVLLLSAFLLVVHAGVAQAQSLAPTARAWADAERVLRAHYATENRALLEVTPKREHAMGTVFWVRFSEHGGGPVAVRGGEVLDAPGDATVSAILRADDLHGRRAWRAADLVALITTFGTRPPLSRAVVDGARTPALAPRVTYGHGTATLVVYAYRDGPPEDAAHRSYYVERATGVIDASYVVHWTVANVVLDLRGRERRPPPPSQYELCSTCLRDPTACGGCRNARCRDCLAHSAVLTDPSFCLPRCR